MFSSVAKQSAFGSLAAEVFVFILQLVKSIDFDFITTTVAKEDSRPPGILTEGPEATVFHSPGHIEVPRLFM